MIIFYVLAFSSPYCDKSSCFSNQIDYVESFNEYNTVDLAFSFWYKYHLLSKRDQESIYNIFSLSSEQDSSSKLIFSIVITDTYVTHNFVNRETPLIWDRIPKVKLSGDQDVWHFFIIYHESPDICLIQIISNNQMFGGIGYKFLTRARFINNSRYRSDIFIQVCAQDDIKSSDFSQIPFLSKCEENKDQNITVQYHPEILQYKVPKINVDNAKLHIWLKDASPIANFVIKCYINYYAFNLDKILSIYEIVKDGRAFKLTIMNSNLTESIFNNDIKTYQELEQWYFIYIDHSQSLIIQTVLKQYMISFQVETDLYVNLELNIENTIFSQFMISDRKIESCPPNCNECLGIICIKCSGNRIGSDCSCPPDQEDFGLKSCEYRYLKMPVQIIEKNQSCPTGYLQCDPYKVICDNNYIQFKNSCTQCPTLGTEICRQCLTVNEITQDQLKCSYTSSFNLLLFKTYQIEDYMNFLLYHKNDKRVMEQTDYMSVTIFYRVFNHQFQPIDPQNLNYKFIKCPYNYYFEYSSDICRKLPKSCLEFVGYSCLSCREGYSLINRVCMKCPQNCISCNLFRCTSCFEGYYVSLDGSCKFCGIPNCKICYEYSNDLLSLNDDFYYGVSTSLCALCDEEYEFNYDTIQCQAKSMNNCQISIFHSKQICLIDIFPNLKAISISCEIKECDQCYLGKCLVCRVGYYLDSEKCISCNALRQFYENNNTISCYGIDPINHKHIKTGLQHIFFYYNQTNFYFDQLQLFKIRCLNNYVLYDNSQCQPINNEYIDHQSILYCTKYLLTPLQKPYCIETKSSQNIFSINRLTGQVLYCGGLRACSRIMNYKLEMQDNTIYGYLYQDIYFKSIQNFIDSLNYAFLISDQIEQINIEFNYISYQEIINRYNEIPINLIIKKLELRMQFIQLINMNTISIETLVVELLNIQCHELTIEEIIPKGFNSSKIQINSTILNIKVIHIIGKIDNVPSFQLIGQKMISFGTINIFNDCQNSEYFGFINEENLFVDIQNLIITESNLTNCKLLTFVRNHHLSIHNLTIYHSIIQESLLINGNSLNIDYIQIEHSTVNNSVLFLTNGFLNLTNQIIIIDSVFQNSSLIVNTYISQINQIRANRCIMITTYLLFFLGKHITINEVKLLEQRSISNQKYKGLIQIQSQNVTISEFYNHEYTGNSSVIIINAQYIYLSRFNQKNRNPYIIGEIDEQCQINPSNSHSDIYINTLYYYIFDQYPILNRYPCDILAEKYGGGGHEGAASIYMDKKKWLEFVF